MDSNTAEVLSAAIYATALVIIVIIITRRYRGFFRFHFHGPFGIEFGADASNDSGLPRTPRETVPSDEYIIQQDTHADPFDETLRQRYPLYVEAWRHLLRLSKIGDRLRFGATPEGIRAFEDAYRQTRALLGNGDLADWQMQELAAITRLLQLFNAHFMGECSLRNLYDYEHRCRTDGALADTNTGQSLIAFHVERNHEYQMAYQDLMHTIQTSITQQIPH